MNNISHHDLSSLMNIKSVHSKLEGILTEVEKELKLNRVASATKIEFAVKREEHILIYNSFDHEIKIGFRWIYGDIYLGCWVGVGTIDKYREKRLSEILKRYNWGYENNNSSYILSCECRMIDHLFNNEEYEIERSSLINSFIQYGNEAIEILKIFLEHK